jgi:hypothetical protein
MARAWASAGRVRGERGRRGTWRRVGRGRWRRSEAGCVGRVKSGRLEWDRAGPEAEGGLVGGELVSRPDRFDAPMRSRFPTGVGMGYRRAVD